MPLELKGKVSLDGSGFDAGLRNLQSRSKGFGDFLSGPLKNQLAGAFTVGALVSLTKRTIDYASQINDLSIRLGISATALQEFDIAARQNGSSLETVTKAIQNLAKAQREAIESPKGDVANSLKNLGVSIDQLKKTEDSFRNIASTIQESENPAAHLVDLLKVMGQQAGELLPVFASGFAEAADQAKAFGAIIDDDLIQQLDEVSDKFELLKASARGPVARTAGFFADRAREVMQSLQIGVGGAGAFAGALVGGASFEEALDAVGKNADEIIQKQKEAEAAIFNERRRRAKALGAEIDLEGRIKEKEIDKTAKQQGRDQATVNQLQRIGAFVAGKAETDQMLRFQRDLIIIQRNMLQKIDKLEKEISSGGAYSSW